MVTAGHRGGAAVFPAIWVAPTRRRGDDAGTSHDIVISWRCQGIRAARGKGFAQARISARGLIKPPRSKAIPYRVSVVLDAADPVAPRQEAGSPVKYG